MEPKFKLNVALGMIRPDLREEFLRDLVCRLFPLIDQPLSAGTCPAMEFSATIEHTMEDYSVGGVSPEWRRMVTASDYAALLAYRFQRLTQSI